MSPEKLSYVARKRNKLNKERVCYTPRAEKMWNRDVRTLLNITKFRVTLLTDYSAFWATWLKISSDITSGEKTFGWLDLKPFWNEVGVFYFLSFRSKTHQQHAYYLRIEWSAWTVLTSLRRERPRLSVLANRKRSKNTTKLLILSAVSATPRQCKNVVLL